MGATFGAATKALFASVVFAAEVTGEYAMIVPLMIGVAAAELVVELFLTDRLMTQKLAHRGFRVDFRTEVDALRMRVAHQIMRGPVSVAADASVVEARRLLVGEGLPAIAVVDAAQRYLGVVTAADLQQHPDSVALVGPLARLDIAPIRPREFLVAAHNHFAVSGVDALPVVQDNRVVGQLDRTDIDAARHRHQTSRETLQPGWLAQLRGRDMSAGSPRIGPGAAVPVAAATSMGASD
jgi:CBS domain-containing protein